ncbi:MAG TPA: VOC family protein [Steroidobacteraceae bacterium]|nr:VOC family protein [Steroidobacteraceae bacterium]
MGLVGFGQPDDGIIQMCYVVPDIQAAMNTWVHKLKVGPWFLLDHFTGTDPKYRGRDSTADVSLAMSFAGHMNIELIQPNNDAPSVYKEWIDRRGYGFHHWGRATAHFERDVAKYQAEGHALVFLAGVPSGGHVAYMDTTAVLPGYVELIELGEAFEALFSKFYRASIGWDGADPVRSFI